MKINIFGAFHLYDGVGVNGIDKLKKFCCFWKNGKMNSFLLLFLEKRRKNYHFLSFSRKTEEYFL